MEIMAYLAGSSRVVLVVARRWDAQKSVLRLEKGVR